MPGGYEICLRTDLMWSIMHHYDRVFTPSNHSNHSIFPDNQIINWVFRKRRDEPRILRVRPALDWAAGFFGGGPDALILCYPGIRFGPFGHLGLLISLLGEEPEAAW